MTYADLVYYFSVYGGTKLPRVTESEQLLERASGDVDMLTYNRIVTRGFAHLTEFQRSSVREAVCRIAEFRFSYADLIDSPYQSYSINGVSVSAGSGAAIIQRCGAMLPASVYSLLCSTGLCYGGV